MEEIKQHFPNRYVVNVGVAPFTRGESPLQHYNSLLTLSWMQQYSDCTLIIHNSDLLQPHCTIEDINRAIACSLVHCLTPLGPRYWWVWHTNGCGLELCFYVANNVMTLLYR